MTDPARRESIREALARADEALRAAQALVDAGLFTDAVSRAYYAAFHYLSALLLSRGLEARAHGGALHLLNREFIRSGLLPTAHNRLLAGLQRTRELADYDPAVDFCADDARSQIEEARAFAADALEILRREGWTD